jgi:hypothetical protein
MFSYKFTINRKKLILIWDTYLKKRETLLNVIHCSQFKHNVLIIKGNTDMEVPSLNNYRKYEHFGNNICRYYIIIRKENIKYF